MKSWLLRKNGWNFSQSLISRVSSQKSLPCSPDSRCQHIPVVVQLFHWKTTEFLLKSNPRYSSNSKMPLILNFLCQKHFLHKYRLDFSHQGTNRNLYTSSGGWCLKSTIRFTCIGFLKVHRGDNCFYYELSSNFHQKDWIEFFMQGLDLKFLLVKELFI